MAESRNVLSYVKAQRKALKLETQYRAKLEKLEPLKRRVDEAKFQATSRKMRLTGGQMMQAIRMLGEKECSIAPMVKMADMSLGNHSSESSQATSS